jgi:hypothetical protein
MEVLLDVMGQYISLRSPVGTPARAVVPVELLQNNFQGWIQTDEQKDEETLQRRSPP